MIRRSRYPPAILSLFVLAGCAKSVQIVRAPFVSPVVVPADGDLADMTISEL